MNKNLIIMIITGLLIVACQPMKPAEPAGLNVEQAVLKLQEIDQKYGANWKKEILDGFMIDAPQEMIDEIQGIPTTNHSKILINARVQMLESEQAFIQAKKLDPRELADMEFDGTQYIINASLDEFNCSNSFNISQAMILYEQSMNKANYAKNLLDEVMNANNSYFPYIGVNQNRTLFYISPLKKVSITIKINKALLQNYCAKKAAMDQQQ